MFRPIADARYWFQSAAQEKIRVRRAGSPTLLPPRGALVLSDGSTVELDYTDRADEGKIGGPDAAKVVGLAWRDRQGKGWSAEVRGDRIARHRGVGATLAEAVAAATDAYYTAEAAEADLREDSVAHLDRELARHDWWAHMSDSYGTALAGERHMQEILGIAARCPADTVRALWAKYAPTDGPACPV